MNTKSKLLLALLASLLTCGTAVVTVAADAPPASPAAPTTEQLAKLEADIGLNAEQKAKVTALLDQMKSKRRAIKENASLDRDQKKQQTKVSDEAIRAQIKAAMSAEQFAKWDKLQEAIRLTRK